MNSLKALTQAILLTGLLWCAGISPAFSKDQVLDLSDYNLDGPNLKYVFYSAATIHLAQGDCLTVKLSRKASHTQFGSQHLKSSIHESQSAIADLENDIYTAVGPGSATIVVYPTGPGIGIIGPVFSINVIVSALSPEQTKSLIQRAQSLSYGRTIMALAQISEKDSMESVYSNISNLEKSTKNLSLSREERQLAQFLLQSLGPKFRLWLAAHPLSWDAYLKYTLAKVHCTDAGPVIRANIKKTLATPPGYERFRLIQSYTEALASVEEKKCIPFLYALAHDSQTDVREQVFRTIEDLTKNDYYKRKPPSSQSWSQWWQAHAREYGVSRL